MDSQFFAVDNIRALARQIEAEVRKTTRSQYTFDVPANKMADRMADLVEANPHLLEARYGTRELNAMLVHQAVEALTSGGAHEYMLGNLRSERKVRGLVQTAPEPSGAAVTMVAPYKDDYKRLIAEEQALTAHLKAADPLQYNSAYMKLQAEKGRLTDKDLTAYQPGGA